MKALLKYPTTPGLVMQEVPVSPLLPGTARIEMHSAGICGTDLLFYTGRRELPTSQAVILGHELSGVICAISKPVEDSSFHVGDSVTIDMVTGCGLCSQCGRNYKLGCQKSKRIGITIDGGFAEYITVPITNLCHLPDDLGFEQATFADPLACAYKGIGKLGHKEEVSDVLILGSGVIGILSLQLLRLQHKNCTIVVVDHHVERLAIARQWASDCASNVDDLVMLNRRFDLVIEASGSVDLFTIGLGLLRPRGAMLLLGVHLQRSTINTSELLQKEIEIIPSLCYEHHHMQESLQLLSRRLIEVEPMIYAAFHLDHYAEAFDTILMKRAVKVLFKIK